jgi:hypothetical protein
MRKLLLAVCAAGLGAAVCHGQLAARALCHGQLAARATGPDEEAQGVIERAVKAHGGLDRLSRVRADRVASKGVLVVNGAETPFTSETTVQLPGQFRNVIRLQGERKTTFVQILNGDKVYFTIDGQPQKADDQLTAELRQTLLLNQAVRLTPLLTDKAFTLEALGEVKVEDQPCLGVKASAKGRPDVRLFFNKETALLVKTEHAVDDGAGKQVVQEEFYSEFEEVNGVRRPMKISAYRNGKKVMEAEVTDVKYLDKVDDAEFAKP